MSADRWAKARPELARVLADDIAARNGWPGRGDKFLHVGGPLADAVITWAEGGPTEEEEAKLNAIQAQAARHMLGFMGEAGGYMPGMFTTKLIETMLLADEENAVRLAAGFPELAHCVDLYKNHEDGLERLRAMASGGAS